MGRLWEQREDTRLRINSLKGRGSWDTWIPISQGWRADLRVREGVRGGGWVCVLIPQCFRQQRRLGHRRKLSGKQIQVLALPLTRNLLLHYFIFSDKVFNWCTATHWRARKDTEPSAFLQLWRAWDSCNLRASHQLWAALRGLQSGCGQENNGP